MMLGQRKEREREREREGVDEELAASQGRLLSWRFRGYGH